MSGFGTIPVSATMVSRSNGQSKTTEHTTTIATQGHRESSLLALQGAQWQHGATRVRKTDLEEGQEPEENDGGANVGLEKEVNATVPPT